MSFVPSLFGLFFTAFLIGTLLGLGLGFVFASPLLSRRAFRRALLSD